MAQDIPVQVCACGLEVSCVRCANVCYLLLFIVHYCLLGYIAVTFTSFTAVWWFMFPINLSQASAAPVYYSCTAWLTGNDLLMTTINTGTGSSPPPPH